MVDNVSLMVYGLRPPAMFCVVIKEARSRVGGGLVIVGNNGRGGSDSATYALKGAE